MFEVNNYFKLSSESAVPQRQGCWKILSKASACDWRSYSAARSSRCMKSHFCKASFLMSAMVLLAFNGQKVDQTDWEETGRWQVVGGTLSEMDQNKQNRRSRACSMCSDNGLKWVTKLWGQQTCIKYIIMFWCLDYCHVFFYCF